MAKREVVTQKMLDDSEYTNLRDYLNAQRGLRRKDGSAPEYKPGREPAAPSTSEPKDYTVASAGMQSPDMAAAMRRGYEESDATKEEASAPKRKSTLGEDAEYVVNRLGRGFGRMGDAARELFATKSQRSSAKKDVVEKAKGGSVSSASKRGDGCAQRGKTKGRFV